MKYAVPCVLLVDASSVELAIAEAGEVQFLIYGAAGPKGPVLMVDDDLPAFAYDPALHQVLSATDYDECAIPQHSEEKKKA